MTAVNVSDELNFRCRSTTLVDSASPGRYEAASFFSTPDSLDDSGNNSTATTIQNTSRHTSAPGDRPAG